MNEAVAVASLGLIGSMGAIVVVATLAGVLLYVLDPRIDHGDHH